MKRTGLHRRVRNTGPDIETKQAMLERDGWRCLDCGTDMALTPGHRKNRSQGGTNRLSNLVTQCVWCNDSYEADAARAETARRNGWKLRRGDDPMLVAVLYGDGRRYVLNDEGGRILLSH